jgi:hypothetical protein
MLLIIAAVLVLLWLIGLTAHIAGVFIHILLIIALIILIIHFLKGRK